MSQSETVAFLRCVLPAEGFYVAVVFEQEPSENPNARRRQIVVDTIDKLADVILQQDQLGRTVYHACASFKEIKTKGLRAKENARAVAALWADIDCGAGKAYPGPAQAYGALVGFCRAAALPAPVVVGSGQGLHCYWPLAEEISLETFAIVGPAFKQLCLTHGLAIDPTRTADVASILRTPGTHNRKHGGNALVQSSQQPVQRSTLESLRRLCRIAPGWQAHALPRADVASGFGGRQRPRVLAAIDHRDPADFPASYVGPIIRECAQLGAFGRTGRLVEPHWHGCIGVVAWCVDGRKIAHQLSANGDARYRPSETDDRINRVLQLTGPTTCAKLNDVNPGLCSRCPHFGKIVTPLTLGQHEYSARTTPASPATAQAPGGERTAEAVQLPAVRDPFCWSEKGQLLFRTEDRNGAAQNTVIVDFPIFLDTVHRGELDDEGYTYGFRGHHPKDGWRSFAIPASEAFSSHGSSAFAKKGVVIHDPKCFFQFLRQSVDGYHQNQASKIMYDQFGWKTNGFVFGRFLYTAGGPLTVDATIAGNELMEDRMARGLGPTQRGSVHAWTEAANSLYAPQMEAHGAAVLASFAAALMHLMWPTEGGAMLHIYYPGSGSGKTTALQGGWTVWGKKKSMSLTNEDTKVSKYIVLGCMGHLPVFYDEMHNKDPAMIRDHIMIFTQGSDRLRGTGEGRIKRTLANWCTVHLSASNKSVVELVGTDGQDAAGFRVLELTATLVSQDKAAADAHKNTLEENAGHAGHAFLRYLVAPGVREWVVKALEQYTREIWAKTGLPDAHRFRVRLVAAITVAALIVNKLDLLQFDTQRIINYLIEELRSPANAGTISNQSAVDRSTAALGEFLAAHNGQCLNMPDKWRPQKPPMMPLGDVPRGALTMRSEVATRRLYISLVTFRDWCTKKDISPRDTLSSLLELGAVLQVDRRMTLTAGSNIPGAQMPVVECDLNHPVLSGMLTLVTSLEQANEAAR